MGSIHIYSRHFKEHDQLPDVLCEEFQHSLCFKHLSLCLCSKLCHSQPAFVAMQINQIQSIFHPLSCFWSFWHSLNMFACLLKLQRSLRARCASWCYERGACFRNNLRYINSTVCSLGCFAQTVVTLNLHQRSFWCATGLGDELRVAETSFCKDVVVLRLFTQWFWVFWAFSFPWFWVFFGFVFMC